MFSGSCHLNTTDSTHGKTQEAFLLLFVWVYNAQVLLLSESSIIGRGHFFSHPRWNTLNTLHCVINISQWDIFIRLLPKLLSQGTRGCGWWWLKAAIPTLLELLDSTVGDQIQPFCTHRFCFALDQNKKILVHCVHGYTHTCIYV